MSDFGRFEAAFIVNRRPGEGIRATGSDETVAIIYCDRGEGRGVRHFYKSANPDARPQLYRCLDDTVIERLHPGAIRILGYIGDDSDVVKLSQICDRFNGALDSTKKNTLQAILEAWAVMSRRGVLKAGAEVEKYCTTATWGKASFSWFSPDVIERNPPSQNDGPMAAIRIFATFGDADWEALRDQLLVSVQNPAARERINYYLSERFIERAIAVRKEAESLPITDNDRESLRRMFRRLQEHEAQTTGSDGRISVQQEEPRRPKPAFIAPGAETVLTEADHTLVRQIIQGALDAYEECRGVIEKGDNEAVSACLLDNGKRFEAKRLRELQLRDEYVKDLAATKDLIGALRKHNIVHRNFTVLRTTTYKCASLPDKENVQAAKSEEITVTWELDGSRDVVEAKRLRLQGVGPRTVTADGTLIAVLKQIDGMWYWNPFGW